MNANRRFFVCLQQFDPSALKNYSVKPKGGGGSEHEMRSENSSTAQDREKKEEQFIE